MCAAIGFHVDENETKMVNNWIFQEFKLTMSERMAWGKQQLKFEEIRASGTERTATRTKDRRTGGRGGGDDGRISI